MWCSPIFTSGTRGEVRSLRQLLQGVPLDTSSTGALCQGAVGVRGAGRRAPQPGGGLQKAWRTVMTALSPQVGKRPQKWYRHQALGSVSYLLAECKGRWETDTVRQNGAGGGGGQVIKLGLFAV